MEFLKFKADDGTEIVFDTWEKDEDIDGGKFYWVTVCGKCLKKYGAKLGSRVSDDGSGCCSVCGCNTPSPLSSKGRDLGVDARYVDFYEDDNISFCDLENAPLSAYQKRKEEVRADAVRWFFHAPIDYDYIANYEQRREEIIRLGRRYGLLREFLENGIIKEWELRK